LGRFITSCLSDPLRQNAIWPIDGSGPAMTPLEMGKTLFKTLGMTPEYRAMSPA
jgi:divinyl chlorophyllide a 8-vinyl-reductase